MYLRSPEARQRDLLREQLEAAHERIRDLETERGTEQREAEQLLTNARRQAAMIRVQANRMMDDADAYANEIRAMADPINAQLEATKREAAQLLATAERDARRMRTAAHRYLQRKQADRPMGTLLEQLRKERYGI